MYEGYPHEILRMWRGLPADFKNIDTVFENREGKIIFFIGKWGWCDLNGIL